MSGFAGGRVELDDGSSLAAKTLILATGATRALEAVAPELARLTPVKGHILHAAATWPSSPVLRNSEAYLCRTPGELVLGATMEAGVDDAAIDAGVVASLVARGGRLAPDLARLTWSARTGVRAATPDGLPMVGASRSAGVILAVGARRNGWLLAPLIAETVAGLVEGGELAGPAALFDPGRF